MPWDLNSFDLSAAEACGQGLAVAMRDAETLEAAGRAGCAFLRSELLDSDGSPACALVRCYKTHDFGQLPTDIQRVAKRAYGSMAFSPPDPGLKCLILLATVGDEPAWNDRRKSANHQAIPLPSREIVESAPMIAQLVRELGLDVSQIVQPNQGLVRELAGKSYGVFHVAEANGSPYIPAQDFVRKYGIASVIGFGGSLPNNELAAIIGFTRVPVSIGTADRFRTLALDLSQFFARYDRSRTFDPASQTQPGR